MQSAITTKSSLVPLLAAAGLLFALAAPASADVIIDTGGTYVIDSSNSILASQETGTVYISNSTTVEVVAGGRVELPIEFSGFDSSSLRILGGHVRDVIGYNGGSVAISSGTIDGNAGGWIGFSVSGGQVNGNVGSVGYGGSVSDGVITGGASVTGATLTITGGQMNAVFCNADGSSGFYEGGDLRLRGGTILHNVNAIGGEISGGEIHGDLKLHPTYEDSGDGPYNITISGGDLRGSLISTALTNGIDGVIRIQCAASNLPFGLRSGSGAATLKGLLADGSPLNLPIEGPGIVIEYDGCATTYCMPVDFNGDCSVDSTDLNMLLASFGTPSGAEFYQGDANFDGVIDSTDLSIVLSAFGYDCNDGQAVFVFDDLQEHIISDGSGPVGSWQDIEVINPGTIVRFASGGIAPQNVHAYSGGLASVEGGTVNGDLEGNVEVHSGTVFGDVIGGTIYGGEVFGDVIGGEIFGGTIHGAPLDGAAINGGTFVNSVTVAAEEELVIGGGTFQSDVIALGGEDCLDCGGTSEYWFGTEGRIVMSGGTIEGQVRLIADNSPRTSEGRAVLHLCGGEVLGGVVISGGDGHGVISMTGGLIAGEVLNEGHTRSDFAGGTIDQIRYMNDLSLYGTNFNYPYGPVPVNDGTLTGTLSDGTPMNMDFVGSNLKLYEPNDFVPPSSATECTTP